MESINRKFHGSWAQKKKPLGEIELRILHFLYKYREYYFYVREIAQGINHQEDYTYTALQRLLERNFVKKGKLPKYTQWRLNTEADILKEIKQELGLNSDDEEDEIFILKTSLKILLPIITTPQVYCTYKLAESMYSSWREIERCYESYNRGDIAGLSKTIVKNMVASLTGSEESRIIWQVIENKIPLEDRHMAKDILDTVIDKLTEKEMGYVEQYLQQN